MVIRAPLRGERGLTLVEVLSGVALAGVLVALGALALRMYWLANALDRADGEISAALKQTQQRVVAETHPLVYGAWFKAANSTWGIVRFDPHDLSTTADDVCVKEPDQELRDGVVVDAVEADTTSVPALECLGQVPGASFVFFYARGTATDAAITLRRGSIDHQRVVNVLPMTGRVE